MAPICLPPLAPKRNSKQHIHDKSLASWFSSSSPTCCAPITPSTLDGPSVSKCRRPFSLKPNGHLAHSATRILLATSCGVTSILLTQQQSPRISTSSITAGHPGTSSGISSGPNPWTSPESRITPTLENCQSAIVPRKDAPVAAKGREGIVSGGRAPAGLQPSLARSLKRTYLQTSNGNTAAVLGGRSAMPSQLRGAGLCLTTARHDALRLPLA